MQFPLVLGDRGLRHDSQPVFMLAQKRKKKKKEGGSTIVFTPMLCIYNSYSYPLCLCVYQEDICEEFRQLRC